ncbi:DDE transposase family protein [Thermus scotoductus]|uniref:DDE transposase family protein n=1 Tax=Thermus scotoductus TaxID=37636 RepID=A0A430SED5_THESC|nr:DDE transposase family protein [Thermus scotoductus]RTI09509.1 DDE transposase family protein [Thermus scotoductus]
MAWLREVFAGMRERRLPGETEWLREEERDGEVRRYRVWASPHLPAEVRRFPGARQVVWVEREVVHKGSGEVKRGERYGVTSLGPEEADAEVLGRWFLGRWEIENGSFWVRDVLFREDGCQVRGRGAEVLAGLRGFLVSLLHGRGIRRKKAALESFSFHPLAALRFLGWDAV